jgi:hypothetical protein
MRKAGRLRAAGGALLTTACAAVLAVAAPAFAGPPYVTDDPEPTDLGHWEIYNFVSGSHIPGDTAGQGGFDINYGGAKDLQLTMVVPIDYQTGAQPDLGDIELAAKYRFLHQAAGGWTPDLAFFPRLFTPTGSGAFAGSRLSVFLPIWAQKDFGKWSLFGGGGYDINPGRDNRDFWLSGLGLSRAITDRFSLGAEIYYQTADARDAKAFTGLNIGTTYKLTDHWSLLASAGPGVQNARRQGQYDFYFSLEATY